MLAQQKAVQKIVLLAILFLINACASAPQTQRLLATPNSFPNKTELSHTPFFPQQHYQCGPAALATLLKHSGVNIDSNTLVDEVYLPSRLGSLQLEILASTRRHGRLPYRITPDMHTLLSEVVAGNPVLVLQNLGLSWAPQWHYAVVIGFDLNKRDIILRSGTNARHVTSMNTFELTWARSQYWGIVVTPPDKLPSTATAEQYLRTIIALENTSANKQQWHRVHRAYRNAQSRWPHNLIVQMGLGNSAYQLGELNTAARAFRNAVQNHPDAGAAHNNLAQVLLKQGKLNEAEKQVRRAIALAGPYLESYRATLTEIQQAKNIKP